MLRASLTSIGLVETRARAMRDFSVHRWSDWFTCLAIVIAAAVLRAASFLGLPASNAVD
jgi:hypothetical protein